MSVDRCSKCSAAVDTDYDSEFYEDGELCAGCRENAAEAAYERQQEEGFRGGEYAAYSAEQQAKIQRELK